MRRFSPRNGGFRHPVRSTERTRTQRCTCKCLPQQLPSFQDIANPNLPTQRTNLIVMRCVTCVSSVLEVWMGVQTRQVTCATRTLIGTTAEIAALSAPSCGRGKHCTRQKKHKLSNAINTTNPKLQQKLLCGHVHPDDNVEWNAYKPVYCLDLDLPVLGTEQLRNQAIPGGTGGLLHKSKSQSGIACKTSDHMFPTIRSLWCGRKALLWHKQSQLHKSPRVTCDTSTINTTIRPKHP